MEHAMKKKLHYIDVDIDVFKNIDNGAIKSIIIPISHNYSANDMIQLLCTDGINSGSYQITAIAQHEQLKKGYQLVSISRLSISRLMYR